MPKVMFSLPAQLVIRMKYVIPAGERSELLAALLEKVIQERENSLYNRAMELESSAGLNKEAAEWDAEFGQDGLTDL